MQPGLLKEPIQELIPVKFYVEEEDILLLRQIYNLITKYYMFIVNSTNKLIIIKVFILFY